MSGAGGHSLGTPLAIVVMGVAGSGKTVVGEVLAEKLGATFIEGDQFHPPHNVALMRSGTPLTDEDRELWLDSIGREIVQQASDNQTTVTACSALKRIYRERLQRFRPDILFLFLEVDRQTAEQRVAARRNHFMPASLVDSQFQVLDPPHADENSLTMDATLPVELIVTDVLGRLPKFQLASR
jgi:gluconokinase